MLKILNIVLVAVLFVSCNKATIDLRGFEPSENNSGNTDNNNALLGKWKLDSVTEEGKPEEPEEDLDGSEIFIEFLSNGKVKKIFIFMDEDNKPMEPIIGEGTYKLSDDKKTLTIDDEDGKEVVEITSLTSTSLIYRSWVSLSVVGGDSNGYWASMHDV